MKHLALLVTLLGSAFSTDAQNPFFDQQFRGFRVFFEAFPELNQASQIAVSFPACRDPFSQASTAFPTETNRVGSEITVTFAFWVPNAPGCLSGLIERYAIPSLQQGFYSLKVNARLIDPGSVSVPPRILETRTMAQLNFQIGEPLATQVPNLTPVGFALMSLMMLGVGAFVSGRRYS